MNLTKLALGLLAAGMASQAAVYTFQPYDASGNTADIGDLDHRFYYYWDIDASALVGQHILSAVLTMDNVTDTDLNPADILYINLVDNRPAGMRLVGGSRRSNVYIGDDVDDAVNANQFAGNPLIGVIDPPPYALGDLAFEFDATLVGILQSYIADGRTGIGFDPDCAFANDGVTLTITTPDGGTTLALMGLGVLGLGAMRRRFVSK